MIPEQNISVKYYNEKITLFHKMDVEERVGELYNNKVPLPSGGSIVIDQTEALVAIDVNSGKATKEKSIEDIQNIEFETVVITRKFKDIENLKDLNFE